MGDFIEFYITCNPPLRPKGVQHVLAQLKESKIEYVEILYEPSAPWFQCSVSKRQQNPLVNFLTSLLYEILARETDEFELDTRAGDIEIIADDPLILSWGAFLQLTKEQLDEYEPYRYPESFRRFAFKTIWQKLRSIDAPEALTIKSLLKREGNFDWSVQAFMDLVGCEMSFNVQEDILYIASDNKSSIDEAIRRLDSLFKYRKHVAPPPTQLILPPAGSSDWRLCLRPISKFPLAKSTIIQTNAVTAKDDYDTLYTKGVIFTYLLDDLYDEEWGFPECPPIRHTPLPRGPFLAFSNYSYPAKQATKIPSARGSVTECTMPIAISNKTAAAVSDWVRDIGEARGTSLSPDDDLLGSGKDLLQHFGSLTESDQLQGAQDTAVHNILDDDNSYIENRHHLDARGILGGPAPQDAFQKYKRQEDMFGMGGGISAPAMGLSKGGSSLKFAGSSAYPPSGSALADLAGLSIPIAEEVRASNELAEPSTPEKRGNSTPILNLKTSDNGSKNHHERLNVNNDLLDADDGDDLQDLMAPIFPTLTPQPRLGAPSPLREYRQTMNQRAPYRGRYPAQRYRSATQRPSPSPPSSAHRRSKIPVKSRALAPGTRSAQFSGVGDGDSEPAQTSTVVRGSQIREAWNTGLRGEAFGDVVLPPVLQDSIKKRSYFERALEGCLAGMLSRARMMTGKVSMEIAFCRIVLENVANGVINAGRVDQEQASFQPLRILNELAVFGEGDFRSHTILSLNGNDANRLKDIHWTSKPERKWQQYDTEVFYDFGCEDLTSNRRFIIQVNARDFTHSFESQNFVLEDLVFIHCPDRSWDLNAYVKATDTAYFKDKYEDFARYLVESLAVEDGHSCGDPHFTFRESGKYRVSVERVRVRHVARYRDGHGGNTFLNITMWQATNMDWDAVEDSNRSTRNIKVEPSENDDTKGLANVWYEASISSVRAERAFQENAKTEFGQEVQWIEKELENEGIFRDLYGPAISMVERMDEIGSGNDNGRQPPQESVLSGAEPQVEGLEEKLFW